jgi:hypothetical protein
MSTEGINRWRRWLCALGLCACLAAPAHADRRWPELSLPTGVSRTPIAEELELNGVPLRVQGLRTTASADALAAALRARLGGAVVESRLGRQRLLGHAQGGFYTTVQIDEGEIAPGGVRALLVTADLARAAGQLEQQRALAQRWLQRLPAGSQLLSHTRARDGDRWSDQLVYRNGLSEALNARALGTAMEALGMAPRQRSANGRVLWFEGPGREALAVIGRLPDGRASVVLDTVTPREPLR